MRSVAVFETKNRFSELLTTVEHGEEITITNLRERGKRQSGSGSSGKSLKSQETSAWSLVTLLLRRRVSTMLLNVPLPRVRLVHGLELRLESGCTGSVT